MRLGGPIFGSCADPESWAAAHKRLGYSAAYCPLDPKATDDTVAAFAKAAKTADIVIAEVGAWSNPISTDEKARKDAVQNNKDRLALADRIGARCCVNISGSRGKSWAGPDAANFTRETFDLIVATVRDIIDAVKPARTFYTLECMEWTPPYSTDNYADLLRAIDRKAFAVHFDPVNLIWSPMRYYETGAIIREFCTKLGAHVRSCHAKDTKLSDELTVHLGEVRPGLGNLDYAAFLTEISKLDPDTPIMLEHLGSEKDYTDAAEHIRGVAKKVGVAFK